MGSNCCSGEADKKAEAQAMQKRSTEVMAQISHQSTAPHKDQFQSSYHIIKNKKKLENYLHELGAGAEGIQTLYNNLKDKDYENYQELCSYLTSSDPKITINTHLAKISKEFGLVDRYAMILLECYNVEDYLSTKYDPASTCQFLLPLFFSVYSRDLTVERLTPLIEYLKQKSQKVGTVDQFVNLFKQEFVSYEKVLYHYFVEKLMSENQNYHYFAHLPKSDILDVTNWVELHLKSGSILKHQPTLLYSAAKDGTSFSLLINRLLGYTGPWLLVLSHIENNVVKDKKELDIIGSYQNAPIQDIFQYQGNPDGFLFRLEPTLRYFTVSDGEGESNYFFISNVQSDVRGMRRGIGFGGVNKDDCKLWIDENVDGNSKCAGLKDPTYGGGAMSINEEALKVRDIEIWALGSEDNLRDRDEYLAQKEKEATKARMVDKKELLSGGGAMLFEQTFKHRDQVRGEIENCFDKKPSQQQKPFETGEKKKEEGKERSIIDDLPDGSEKSQPQNITRKGEESGERKPK